MNDDGSLVEYKTPRHVAELSEKVSYEVADEAHIKEAANYRK